MTTKELRILVTGGAGFIGSALVRHLMAHTRHQVLNIDKLTYAGNLRSLKSVQDNPNYRFFQADISDSQAIRSALANFRPDIITHLAAESHVDRSIDEPAAFIQTNMVGTFVLLSEALEYWRRLQPAARANFRFHHISTDEVFGSLSEEGAFTESTAYHPASPYAASKASSDHLVRSWHYTYGLPVIVTNCSNNYGPYQFPEKLIPLTIVKCLMGEPLAVYGKGLNVRDWLFVEDHVRALARVFEAGRPGETYLVGGRAERTNIDVVNCICACFDRLHPCTDGRSFREQITFVADRPGHDHRYAIDPSKLEREFGWGPQESFENGIEQTVRWYLGNEEWWRPLLAGNYAGQRLGLERGQS